MSWDIFIQDFPDVASVNDVPDDYQPKPIGRREELIRQILEIVPTTDFSDPSWGLLDTEDFSIEFDIGDDENVDCLTCHVRGTLGGGACVATIVQRLGLKAFDSTTGEFLDFQNPELGFDKWNKFLSMVKNSNDF